MNDRLVGAEFPRRASVTEARRPAVNWTAGLLGAVAITTFDRLAISPLFKPIADNFRTSIAVVAAVATAYLILYAVAQPASGFVSDARGRVLVMRVALAGGALASALSALAPNLVLLIAARALAGAMYAAVFPTALVYTAEMVPFDGRQRAIGNIMAATAVATAVSVLASGVIASAIGWRVVFAVPALGSALIAFLIGLLPEPPHAASEGVTGQLRAVFSEKWAVFVIAAAFPEGFVLFGFLNYFAPVLEAHGISAAVAGGTFAAYGAGVLLSIPILRALSYRLAAPAMIAVGGAGTILGYAVLAVEQSVLSVVAASLLAGFGFTVMHSTVQTWATEVAPAARGTAVSFFACSLFLGGGAGTALVAPLAGSDRFGLLFALAFVMAVPVVGLLAVGRALYHPPLAALESAV